MKKKVYIEEMHNVVRRFSVYDASRRKILYDFYDGQIMGMKYLSWKDEELSSEDCLEIATTVDGALNELRRLRHESKSI